MTNARLCCFLVARALVTKLPNSHSAPIINTQQYRFLNQKAWNMCAMLMRPKSTLKRTAAAKEG